jgi:hypothetical protein
MRSLRHSLRNWTPTRGSRALFPSLNLGGWKPKVPLGIRAGRKTIRFFTNPELMDSQQA